MQLKNARAGICHSRWRQEIRGMKHLWSRKWKNLQCAGQERLNPKSQKKGTTTEFQRRILKMLNLKQKGVASEVHLKKLQKRTSRMEKSHQIPRGLGQ